MASVLCAQPPANYDESKVGNYVLPNLMKQPDGKVAGTVKGWEQVQRPFLLRQFQQHVYGKMPGRPRRMHIVLESEVKNALDGRATCKQWTIYFSKERKGRFMQVIAFIPNNVTGPVPVFAGLNFNGNHSISKDTFIRFNPQWEPRDRGTDYEANRGSQAHRFPLRMIIDSGFALATAWYGDLEPDNKEGWKKGVRNDLQEELGLKPEGWGAIGAWAWGISRMADLLEKEPRIDAKRMIVNGHSRLGKAALWAGANDQRFAMVVSNNSGEGGAALSRRNFGETIADLNRQFPHWFAPAYKQYSGHADQLPVDQHMLLALVAPRPLYVASATADLWADPRGEYESAWQAQPAYSLYNIKGLPGPGMPPPGISVGDKVGYHIREGKHDMLAEDWLWYLLFARRVL
ncbi:MAG: hypothetical protein MUF29_04930 [Chitinophagaceae bacterium]|jgi:hypothetical protein|nr:hypothetical protein [Chitinophagaceae bacterium]